MPRQRDATGKFQPKAHLTDEEINTVKPVTEGGVDELLVQPAPIGAKTTAEEAIRQFAASRGMDDFEIFRSMQAAEKELFMNDELVIFVAKDKQKGSPPLVDVAVNGNRRLIRRGVPQRVKRMHVERLCYARTTEFSQDLDARRGDEFNALDQAEGMDYFFQVIHDPHPMGAVWLNHLMMQAP